MPRKRVVITGMGAVSPLGTGVARLWEGLRLQKSGIVSLRGRYPEHALQTDAVGFVPDCDPGAIPRALRRSMSRMSLFAYAAAAEAIGAAELPEVLLRSSRTGIVAGSTLGSPDAMEEFFGVYLGDHALAGVRTHTFFKIMSHSVSTNLAQAFGICGRAEGLSAACATGCQAVGLAFELILGGRQDCVVCGGAEEYHLLVSAVFDLLGAGASSAMPPQEAPRPFDTRRTGIACAEGAGMLVLEDLEHARARGAHVLAEVVGYAPSVTTSNIAHPGREDIVRCMAGALADAGLMPKDIGYICAHATATIEGDAAEGLAIEDVFGRNTPVASLKGHLGHTMAASGSLELIAAIGMMNNGLLLPTRNLTDPDPACGAIDLVLQPRPGACDIVLKNSFALGGFNASLVLRRYHD